VRESPVQQQQQREQKQQEQLDTVMQHVQQHGIAWRSLVSGSGKVKADLFSVKNICWHQLHTVSSWQVVSSACTPLGLVLQAA
jgi:hypothetical protein